MANPWTAYLGAEAAASLAEVQREPAATPLRRASPETPFSETPSTSFAQAYSHGDWRWRDFAPSSLARSGRARQSADMGERVLDFAPLQADSPAFRMHRSPIATREFARAVRSEQRLALDGRTTALEPGPVLRDADPLAVRLASAVSLPSRQSTASQPSRQSTPIRRLPETRDFTTTAAIAAASVVGPPPSSRLADDAAYMRTLAGFNYDTSRAVRRGASASAVHEASLVAESRARPLHVGAGAWRSARRAPSADAGAVPVNPFRIDSRDAVHTPNEGAQRPHTPATPQATTAPDVDDAQAAGAPRLHESAFVPPAAGQRIFALGDGPPKRPKSASPASGRRRASDLTLKIGEAHREAHRERVRRTAPALSVPPQQVQARSALPEVPPALAPSQFGRELAAHPLERMWCP